MNISIDWNQVWNETYLKNNENRTNGDCASMWKDRRHAESFLEQSEKNPERIQRIIESLPFTPGSSVLDIGSGPGTLAVPLAGRVDHVTAIEPSEGMVEVMEEYARRKCVSNIDILKKRWEDVDVEVDLDRKYDIVTACYSLGVPDITAAIMSMCRASSGSCHIFWFAGATDWERIQSDLWPILHQNTYKPGPKADILYNALYSMGIYPDMRSYEIHSARKFDTIDSAVRELKERYGADSQEKEDLLADYLLENKTNKRGEVEIGGITNHVHVSWKV
jgi:SAM-dependent methyltransferase